MSTTSPASPMFIAKDVQLLRISDNTTVPLSSLYATSPVVLVLLRRWGCPLCRGYAKKLTTQLLPTLHANGVRLSAVGFEQIGVQEFIAGQYFDINELYLDDKKAAYGGLGLLRVGWLAAMSDLLSASTRAWNDEVRNMGVTGNLLVGDGRQLGGTYILSSQGEVWFEHRQGDFGDHPAIPDMIAVLRQRVPGFKSEGAGVVGKANEEEEKAVAVADEMASAHQAENGQHGGQRGLKTIGSVGDKCNTECM